MGLNVVVINHGNCNYCVQLSDETQVKPTRFLDNAVREAVQLANTSGLPASQIVYEERLI